MMHGEYVKRKGRLEKCSLSVISVATHVAVLRYVCKYTLLALRLIQEGRVLWFVLT